MSEKNWQPGDVVMVDYPGFRRKPLLALVRPRLNANGNLEFAYVDGGFDPVDGDGLLARPLVVLDPEDREQVERLFFSYLDQQFSEVPADAPIRTTGVDYLQAALRDLANPKPRIEEPEGLGAVVELADGEVAVSIDPVMDSARWADRDGGFRYWSDLDVVRVLSEGYEAGESA